MTRRVWNLVCVDLVNNAVDESRGFMGLDNRAETGLDSV